MKKLTFLMLVIFGLAGCYGNGSNNVAQDPTPDPIPNQLKSLSALSVNDEAGAIGNATDLSNDINVLFNAVEPVHIKTGDDLDLVLLRAEGRVND